MNADSCRAWLGRALAVLALSLPLGAASAQTLVMDTEPNDTPQTAQRIAGAVGIRGTMPAKDQDAYLWQVDDQQAQQPWTLTLQGIAGALTIVDVMRLTYGPDGESVTGVQKFFTLGSRDGARPVSVEGLLFEPGEYLFGVAHGGGGRPAMSSAGFGQLKGALGGEAGGQPAASDGLPERGYQLDIQSGRSFRVRALDAKHAREHPQAVSTREPVTVMVPGKTAWFRVQLDDKQAAQRWNLAVQTTVGHALKAVLLDEGGRSLAQASSDAYGRVSFLDLALPAGAYLLQVDGPEQVLQQVSLTAAGARVDGEEAEPNDSWATANRIDPFKGVAGRFQKDSDRDYFQFDLTEEQADQRLAVALTLPDDATARLCLLDGKNQELQCRGAKGPLQLGGLVLEAGSYGLSLARGKAGQDYRLQLSPEGPLATGVEAEPNDTVALATPLVLGQRVRGTLVDGDVDVYRLDVTGEPQLWRFQVTGDGVYRLAYLNGRGQRQQSVVKVSGSNRLRLDSLYLPQGTHYVSVQGDGTGDYTLLSRPQGQPLPTAEPAAADGASAAQPDGSADAQTTQAHESARAAQAAAARAALDPNTEQEPNDTEEHMQALRFGQTRTGGFHHKDDADLYLFTLSGYDHISLALTAPADEGGRMHARLVWEGQRLDQWVVPAGATVTRSGVYPPGAYRVELSTWQASEHPYQMTLSRLPRYGCGVDCEPNHHAGMANPWPQDGRILGRMDPSTESYDTDWYALPVRHGDTVWQVRTASKVQLAVQAVPASRPTTLKRTADDQPYSFTVPGGAQAYLVVYAYEDYDVQASPDGEEPPAAAADLSGLSLGLNFPTAQVAAYARLGQQLDGELVVRNTSGQDVTVRLEGVATDARWQVVAGNEALTVAAGHQATVPVRVQVPDDVWGLNPVQVAVKAEHDSGAQVHAHADIAVGPAFPLVAPAPHVPVPEALQGGLNLASPALGAQLVQDDALARVREPGALFDGEVSVNNHARFRRAKPDDPAYVTVQLAGGGDAEVAGFLFNVMSHRTMASALAEATVSLSDDGVQFDTVWQGRLAPHMHDQPVVLHAPRKARFARLSVEATQMGARSDIELGEWQVIAKPGAVASLPLPFNLADPALGGYVVYAEPPFALGSRHRQLIAPESPASPSRGGQDTVRVSEGGALSWVLSLHDNRAARIDRLVWTGDRAAKNGVLIESVDVDISLAGPLGPWQRLGVWSLAGEGVRTWSLDTPVWARFIRFSTPVVSQRTDYRLPASVAVYEAPSGNGYLSVLGAWGQGRAASGYERDNAVAAPPELDASRTNLVADQAQALAAGDQASGYVSVGEQEHWYRVVVPEGANRLDIRLSDADDLRARLQAQTAAGEPVALTAEDSDVTGQRWSLSAAAGTAFLLRVYEPQRNVMFAWDGSGSVSAYSAQVRQAVTEYARGLQPGRDLANLQPFGRSPVLSEWSGDPYQMMQAVGATPNTSSSAAEETLASASKALAKRDGTRAVVLLTDAETNPSDQLWGALAQGRPRVMAVTMSGSAPSQRLMQSWSMVNGGHYSYVRDAGDMAVALHRASVLLRAPAPYVLSAEASLAAPPADGQLQVRTAPPEQRKAGEVRPGPATAIILDASGSMLQRLGRERRIEIAKRGLTDALARQLPPGTPVSLRVFGHKEAGSCRTDLEIPLGPLDVEAARATISRVQAKNLARTPIADSLAQVRQDLARAQGPRTIVLVTDGEETCDGDPEAVIRQLVSDGFDVRLNIIGFALNDPALARTFGEWARLGGGEYFSADDQQGFESAMSAALTLSYTVWDAQGKQVAEGQVDGEPVTLPPGQYQLRIPLTPELVVGPVPVEPAGVTSLNMP